MVDTRTDRPDDVGWGIEDDLRLLSATSESTALELLETKPVDVVVVDDQTGLDLIEQIYARGHRDVIIVVLTREPNTVAAREAMRLGAYAYMSCPCDPKLLRVMLDHACMQRAHEERG